MSRKTKICRALLAVLGFMATGCGPKLYGPLDPEHGGMVAPMYGVPQNTYEKTGGSDGTNGQDGPRRFRPDEVNIDNLEIEK